MAKRKATSEKLKNNKNAEKWSEEDAIDFFNKAIELSKSKKGDVYNYDFIGEVARELDSYKEIFTYLKDKFKSLKKLHTKLVSTLEANCFYNSKKNNINIAIGIVNLKSNHGWTDRVDNTVNADIKVQSVEPIKWVDDAED
jgi:hypothetical protein